MLFSIVAPLVYARLARRLSLYQFEQFVDFAFAQRVGPYDEPAARSYGEIMGIRKDPGRPMSISDGQIAAIARCNRLTIATRKIADF